MLVLAPLGLVTLVSFLSFYCKPSAASPPDPKHSEEHAGRGRVRRALLACSLVLRKLTFIILAPKPETGDHGPRATARTAKRVEREIRCDELLALCGAPITILGTS